MDLGAYAQIENLSELAARNGICVYRLRGYRLMKNEEPVSKEELDKMKHDQALYACAQLSEAEPPFSINPYCYSFSSDTERRQKKYMIFDKDNKYDPIGVRWENLHGKRRKVAKYVMKRAARNVDRQYALWNKYAGQDNVLYIHARQGSGNWSDTDWSSYSHEPWFLAAVNDYFDPTYCDIYARIDNA